MLKLFFAPPSADLFGAAVKASAREGERLFIVVPRHYSHECERRLCGLLGDGASRYCEVLSLNRLRSRAATECGGSAERFADDAGRLLLTYTAAQRVAANLRVYGGEVRKPRFLAEVMRVIDEFRTFRVPFDTLLTASAKAERRLGDRLYDLALIGGAYEAELVRCDSRTSETEALRELLGLTGWAEDKRFLFYGYTEFNAEELELLRILCRSRELAVALGCDRRRISPDLGELDPLYTYARTEARLRRLAESEGVHVDTVDVPSDDGARPDALRFVESEFMRSGEAEFHGDGSAVTFASESSVWDECERAAAEILTGVRERGLSFRDYAVAIPQDDEYGAAVEAVFGAWGIPFFLDRKTSALSAPILSALSAVLDILRDGFSREYVLRYLKSGLSPVGFEQCCELENYIYIWRINGEMWRKEWDGSPRGFSFDPSDPGDSAALKRLNDSRRTITEPFDGFRKKIRPGETYSADEHLKAFYSLLEELGTEKRIAVAAKSYAEAGDLRTANEYSQLWSKVCGLIDEFSELAGGEPMKFDEFSRLFEMLLEGVQVGTIPPSLDETAVGEPGRLRHRRPKALILLGASGGNFPPEQESGSLLDERDREALEELGIKIEPPARRLGWRSLDAAFAVLTLPSEELHISWAPSGEGGAAAPSPLVKRLCGALRAEILPPSDEKRLLHAVRSALELAVRASGGSGDTTARAALESFRRSGVYSREIDVAREAAEGRRGFLSEEAAHALYGERAGLTASRSDLFRECAFRYFMNYGLRASERRMAELDALESGTLIHAVLENTVRRVSAEGLLDGEIDDGVKLAARSIAVEELRLYRDTRLGTAAASGARTKHLFRRIEGSLMRVVDSIMDEFARSRFRPAGFEIGFGTENSPLAAVNAGEHGQLTGVIDRVDIWRDPETGVPYFRVIDYKSGKKQFDYTDIYHGVSLQLPIYLHALRSFAESRGEDAEEAGAFYSSATEPFYAGGRGESGDDIRAGLEREERRSGIYLSDPKVEEALEDSTERRFLPTEGQYRLTKKQFDLLEKYVNAALEETAESILHGDIAAYPAVRGSYSACDRCPYRTACRFDPSTEHDIENVLGSVSAEKFWDALKPLDAAAEPAAEETEEEKEAEQREQSD